MNIPKPFLFIFAAVLTLGAIKPSQAHAQVTVGFFYNNLSPYGEWVQDPDYGYCWHPVNVDDNWAPYTDGYWAYTDGGWTWVSYEDFGGIVYHYGRWARLPGEGWVWVPGYTWAPAWVSWRSNDDYVGWAPLPPEARFRVGFGFGVGVDAQFDIGPGFYSFVHCGDFGAPALGPVILSRDQNVTIINKTTNITNITYNNSTVYTGGPSYARMAARSTRPIPTLKLVRQGAGSGNGKLLARQQGNSLLVVAPKVTAPSGGKLPPPPKVAKTLTGVTPDHGWADVNDPDQRKELETKFKAEGGPETPAKPVNPEDIKLVTEKTAGSSKNHTTEEETKGKTEKSKTLSTSDLENAPAVEEPKKELSEPTVAKTRKSKKAKTPSLDESATGETEAPKHTPSDANLHPFMGDGSSESSKTPAYSEDEKTHEPATGGETGKGEKKKKKGKAEETPQ